MRREIVGEDAKAAANSGLGSLSSGQEGEPEAGFEYDIALVKERLPAT